MWEGCVIVVFLLSFLTYPRVISYRRSERVEDPNPSSGQMLRRFTDRLGVLHFLCPGLGRGEERAGPREGQGRVVLFSRAEQRRPTPPPPQAMLCGGKSKTRAGQPISLELFTLHNSNRPSSAELLSEARQRADPSAAGMRWLLQNNTNHLILGDTPLQLSRTF